MKMTELFMREHSAFHLNASFPQNSPKCSHFTCSQSLICPDVQIIIKYNKADKLNQQKAIEVVAGINECILSETPSIKVRNAPTDSLKSEIRVKKKNRKSLDIKWYYYYYQKRPPQS